MAKNNDAAGLTDIEKSALGEICDLISSSLAKAFSERLGSDVGMSPSDVIELEFEMLDKVLTPPVLLAHLNCARGLEGQFFIYVNGEGLPNVFDLAVPEDSKAVGADDDFILDQLSAIINDAVSEAMSNLAISMGHNIECSVVDVVVLQDSSGIESTSDLYPEGKLIMASTILGINDTEVSAGHLLPISISSQIINILLNDDPVGSVEEVAAPIDIGAELGGIDATQGYSNDIPLIQELPPQPTPQVEVQPASFAALSYGAPMGGDTSNISLLFDVMLDASIELGKTQMTIEEILKLAKGSVIELDKLASEPVEFLVNGKVIARGEVVVIDDNFGIRITEILSQRARLETI
jgi:flagellar motor switch protein FliN/FliY